MKKISRTILTVTLAVLIQITWGATVSQASFDFKETLQGFQKGITEQSGDLEQGSEEIVLPSYQEDLVGGGNGLMGILKALQTILDFFKLVVAPLAVLFTIIMGVRMVTAGREQEEVQSQAKNYIIYAVEGLLVIFMADSAVEVIYGAQGEVFRGGVSGAETFGRQTAGLLEGIYGLVQTIIGGVAVFVMITAGLRYVAGSYSEDEIAIAKRQLTWSSAGLVVVAISEFVARKILFPEQGSTLGVEDAKVLLVQLTNFAAGTVGTFAFVAMIYAGYLYVTARDNEDEVAKAKKIIGGAFIGIVMALAAFALVNTLVELDATR